jgi:peptide/nickel transport system substrate-binding protein
MPRYCNEAYDALSKKLSQTAKMDERVKIVKELNDMLTDDMAQIPLVYRGQPSAFANTLTGIKMTAWDSELWNVADWSRKK